MGWRRKAIVLGGAVVVAVVLAVVNYYSLDDMSHETIQIQLKLYASSVYEYHAATGQWPARADDLARTSLAQQSPYWKAMLQGEVDIIVWPKDLRPDPRDNARVLLVYHNKGLYARMGRAWVCWGDLRTEYLSTEDLQAHLRADRERR